MNFSIDVQLLEQAPRTRLAVLVIDDVRIGFGHRQLDEMRLKISSRIREEMRSIEAIRMCPQIAGVEQLLSTFDPDTRRPITRVEGLIRRLVEGGHLPVENDAVDAATMLSLYYRLPVHISDRRDIRGNVSLVIGRDTRNFEVMQGQEPIRTQGRLFLADDLGYFASPLALAKRSVVSERTSSILLTALFPENVGDSIVRDFIRRSSNWLESLCHGTVVQEGMVGQPERADA